MNNKILQNKTVLVTGGAGFIGSNLVEMLLQQDNKVVCLDNLATGKKKNIDPFLSNSNFTFIEGDIRNIDDCKKAVNGVEIVLHQAAMGSVPRSVSDPKTTNDVNISGFLNILLASRDAKIKRVVYASSSSVYGDREELPKFEEAIGNPLSPYAASKYMNEIYAQLFNKLYGLETIGLRYFNVYGRRQDPDGPYAAVIPKFIKKIISNESPQIYGDGNQTRDFTYIDDVLQINQLAALTNNPSAINTVYNVAFGSTTSVNKLFELLISNLKAFNNKIAKLKPTYINERPGDIKHSLASIDKAKKLLEYKPQYCLEKGISQAIEWYYYNI